MKTDGPAARMCCFTINITKMEQASIALNGFVYKNMFLLLSGLACLRLSVGEMGAGVITWIIAHMLI